MIVSQKPTPKTKANKTDRRRRPGRKVEILEAVITLLEKGEYKVTTAALAAEVGLSEAALYRHFTGKTAIFKALTDYIEEQLLKPSDKLLKDSDSSLDQLKKLYNHHLAFFAEHPGLCRVFLIEGVVPKEEAEQMIKIIAQYQNSVQKLLVQGQKKRELAKNVDIDAAVNLYVGMIQTAALRFVMSGFKKSPTKEASGSWKLFIKAVTTK
jgi:TetR/AcrR family transcriptional regulator